MSRHAPPQHPEGLSVWPLIWTGLAITLLGVGGLLGWSALSTVSSAAIAEGVVTTESGRRTVQHLEGGILVALDVQEGSIVRTGDRLARLDDVQARAKYDLVRTRYAAALSEVARLGAEQSGANKSSTEQTGAGQLAPPTGLTAPWIEEVIAREPDFQALIDQALEKQRLLLKTRGAASSGEITLIEEQARELELEISGIQSEREALTERATFIQSQIDDIQELVDRGYARKSRLLGLKSGLADVRGKVGRLDADKARAEQRIRELSVRKLQVEKVQQGDVETELRAAESELSDLTEQLRAARDILNRTLITAPVDGIVTQIRLSTRGGVLGPGEALLDIVPSDEDLVIEARLKPDDIDVVQPGLPVTIRMTALDRREAPVLAGTVSEVSPDRLVDDADRSYFAAIVQLSDVEDAATIRVGMLADLEIVTGERRILSYLVDPVMASFSRALKEQ
ncbi:MAG: HlyD family type I secretion periplasmic adaptor subunit [Magnetovibrionaceae bacterium]